MTQNYGSNFSKPILQYQDWWPANLTPGSKLLQSQYESFDILVGRMNSWLAQNPYINIKNFQTLEKKASTEEELDPDYSGFHADMRRKPSIYLKGLRVWYDAETTDNQQISQVSYMNVLPRVTEDSPGKPKYEKQDSLLQQANGNPVPGHIITVETVSMQLHDCDVREVSPDKCHWRDGYKRDVLSFIRIFYTNSGSGQEIIGAEDFLPKCLKEKVTYYPPEFEKPSLLQNKIDDWLRNVQDVRLLNMQYLETPYTDNSDMMDSTVNFVTDYESQHAVRFMRVYFARPAGGSTALPQQVSVKCFFPARLLRTCYGTVTHFQAQSEMNAYVQAWLRLVGRRVIFAERMYRHLSIIENENMYTDDLTVSHGHWHRSVQNQQVTLLCSCMVSGLRVYLDGSYTEPAADQLPPKPHFEDKSCCTIL